MANKRLNSVLRQKFKTKENDTVCVPFKKPVINCYLFEFYKLCYGLGLRNCFKTSSIIDLLFHFFKIRFILKNKLILEN